MKTKLLSIASAMLASGLAIMVSYGFGARGETLWIVAALTLCVSCSTAFVAASIGLRLKKKREAGMIE